MTWAQAFRDVGMTVAFVCLLIAALKTGRDIL